MMNSLEKFNKEEPIPGIKSYNEIIQLGITKDYIVKRGFDETKSIKEMLQNALDENEDVYGYPFVEVKNEKDGLVIEDKGRGFKPEYLLLGSSNKKCWMRGYYGEGLKLAASFFTFSGHPAYIFSNDKVFKFVVVDQAVCVLIGDLTEKFDGTKALVYGYNNPQIKLDNMISIYNEELKDRLIDTVYLSSDECSFEKPARIFDFPDMLFVRNIFAGNASKVARRRSFFSYDVWWVRLDVSRTLQSYSMPDVFKEVARIYEKSEKARKLLAKKLVESGMAKKKEMDGKNYLTFSPTFATFEGHLFVYKFPKGILRDIVDEFGVKKERVKLAIGEVSEQMIKELLNKGVTPFVVASELAETGEFEVVLK